MVPRQIERTNFIAGIAVIVGPRPRFALHHNRAFLSAPWLDSLHLANLKLLQFDRISGRDRSFLQYATLTEQTSERRHDEANHGGTTMKKKMLVSALAALLLPIGIAHAGDPPPMKEGLSSIHRQSIDNPGNNKSDSASTI